ncbi:MAG: heavy metal translocating P-type ATPase metal-binding domain-containing protein [Myxococcota bacterium]
MNALHTHTHADCPHCGLEVAEDAASAPFCCGGCRAANALLEGAGLGRYYALRQGPGLPVGDGPPSEFGWLDELLQSARACAPDSGCASGAAVTLHLDVQGIHCAACVWLIQTLFRRRAGGVHIALDPGLGKLSLTFDDTAFSVRDFLMEIERFGYRTAPARRGGERVADDLLLRLGVCVAIAMNAMMLSLAFYLGLSDTSDPDRHALFGLVGFALATLSVLVGGPVFFRGAIQGLRRRVLHLDLPIALGVGLAWAGMAWSLYRGRTDAAWFDTLSVFVALMLLGRWLQRRIVERNRQMLLADPGIDGLRVRRVSADSQLTVIPAAAIHTDDTLLIAPGELLPVAARLESSEAALSLAWITGEADPQHVAKGARLPAGAHNHGGQAIYARALEPFDASSLRALMSPAAAAGPAAGFWHRVSVVWVVGVLAAATAGFLLWLPTGADAALNVAVAILVVTCPCAVGLATPLAGEIAFARLARRGLFFRREGVLDRLATVRRVVFDKTGTLTRGTLRLANPAAIDALSPRDRDTLYQLVARSAHPRSRAILDAFGLATTAASVPAPHAPPALDTGLLVHEVPGRGLSMVRRSHRYTLGKPPGAASPRSTVAFARDGVVLAELHLEEVLRHDARREVDHLRGLGIQTWIASGDDPARVAAVARTLGVAPERAIGGLNPEAKAALVRRIDAQDTLFIGDGINDGPALDAAWVSATPAIDRPSLPARCDVFVVGSGTGALAAALDVARSVRRVTHRNLAIAAAYNLGGVALAMAGVLTPLVCAIAMPASSLVVIGLTVASLREPTAPPGPRKIASPHLTVSPEVAA